MNDFLNDDYMQLIFKFQQTDGCFGYNICFILFNLIKIIFIYMKKEETQKNCII
jgi:hypothetical protein